MDNSERTKAELTEALAEAQAKIAKLEKAHVACKRSVAVARRRAAQVSLIYEVGQRISGELALEALVVEVVEAVAETFGFRGVLLFLHHPKTGILSLEACAGEFASFFDADFQLETGRGLVGQAAETAETQVAADVAPDGVMRQMADPIRSEMAVPIKSGTHLIGVLDVQSDEVDAFDDSYKLAMEALAVQAAPAIEHARSFEETRSRAERLAVVNRIAKMATATLDFEPLMESVYDEVSQAFQADAFFIAWYDEEAEEIDFCFEIDEGERHDSGRSPLGDGLTSIIITEKRPLVIHNMAEEPDYHEQGIAWGSGRTPASWLGVPLMVDERVIGVLSVQAYRPDAWQEEDERLLFTIADQVAVALERASLFQERERQMTELSVVNEIGRAISSAMQMDDLMETVYQQVARLFRTKNFYIAAYDRVSDMWQVVYLIEEGELLPTGGPRALGSGISGFIIRNRQPVLFKSRADFDDFYEEHKQQVETRGKQALSWMGVPLVVADETVGMMGIQDLEEEGIYDERDLALFVMIAAQVAPALGNLRLLEEARQRAQEMAVINEVGRTITSVLDLSAVLRQIVDITKERFNYYCVSILLVEDEFLVFRSGSVIGDTDRRFWPNMKDVDIFKATSMVTQVARTGEPMLANDVTRNPHFLANSDLPDTCSELTLPIKVKDETIGVLDVQSERINAYRPSDVELLQALANQAGVAIQNARLFEDAHIRAEELAVLNELGQALTAQLNVQEVLEETYRQTSRLVNTTNFHILLYDPDKHELSFAISHSEADDEGHPDVFSADEGLSGKIVKSRKPLLVEGNGSEDDGLGKKALSWLGVPLMVSDEVLGVMVVQSYRTPGLYDEHDRDLMVAIANQTAIALQNARLFEETRRRVREVQMIHDVSLAVASGMRLDETLKSAAETLYVELGDVHVGIALIDPETNRLHRLASGGLEDEGFPSEGVPVGKGVIGWVAEHGTLAVIPDVRQDSRYVSIISDTRSEVCVPLIAGETVIGIINVESLQVDAFSEDDIRLLNTLASNLAVFVERARLFDQMEQRVEKRTRDLRESMEERERLQQEVIEAQQRTLRELSSPVIPLTDRIIVMPLIGSINTMRAREIMRSLLSGIGAHQAKVVILDITGVPVVDSGVAEHLNKTIQAARLKGAHTIVTGISDAVAETIVDLGIDWEDIETLPDLQTGLVIALRRVGVGLFKLK